MILVTGGDKAPVGEFDGQWLFNHAPDDMNAPGYLMRWSDSDQAWNYHPNNDELPRRLFTLAEAQEITNANN